MFLLLKTSYKKHMKKALIFDLDGTLWDSTEEILYTWNAVLARHPEARGVQMTLSQLQGVMGMVLPDIAHTILPFLSSEEAERILDEGCEYEMEYLKEHGAKLYPELEETLAALSRKYRLMIVSNSQDGYVQTFLTHYGMDRYFCDFEMAGRTGRCKGENIRLVMKRNDIEAAVYIGDTQSDYDAAKLAEIAFFHAGYGFGHVSQPCVKLTEFRQLLSLV